MATSLAILGQAKLGATALGWPADLSDAPAIVRANGGCWGLVQDPAILQAITDAADAAAAADTAALAADEARTMAGTATRNYVSTNAASGVPRSDKDRWQQIDATQNVIAEWYWNGTPPNGAWVKTLISSAAISNLDVGKLTASAATINTAVIQKLAVQIATIIELHADRITAGKLTSGQIDTPNLAADLATILELNADRITAGTIGAARLDVNDLAVRIATIIQLHADRITAGTVNTDRLNTNEIAARVATVIQLNADKIIAGTIATARLDVVDIAAKTAAFQTVDVKNLFATTGTMSEAVINKLFAEVVVAKVVTAEAFIGENAILTGAVKARAIDTEDLAANTGFIADLTARIVKSDMFVGKEFIGGVFTGSTFQTSILPDQGIKLDNTGFRAYGPEGGEPVVEISPSGGKALGVSDALSGEVLGGIDSEGGVSGSSLTIEGEARIDGVLILGGDPLTPGHTGPNNDGSNGPVLNGRSLLGGSFTEYIDNHPNVQDHNAWLTVIPHGIIANAWRTEAASLQWDGIGGEPNNRIRLVATAEFTSGRMYSISHRSPGIRDTVGTSSNQVGSSYIRYSSANGSVSAGSGTILPGSRVYIPGGGSYFIPHAMTYVRCPEDIPAGKVMMGVELSVYAGRKADTVVTTDAARWELSIVDMGITRSANSGEFPNLNQQGTAPPPTPPTPAPAKPKQYVDTVSATWWQAYIGGGGQATGSAYNGAAAQGRTPYYTPNGVMRGLIGIPSQASRLSGATVKKIEVYVYAKAWHASAGGTACIGVHGHASKPGSWSSTTDDVKRQKMKRPEGRWITLPSSVHAGFKSGALRGISFLPPSSSTSTEYYGIFTGNKTKFRFTYTR